MRFPCDHVAKDIYQPQGLPDRHRSRERQKKGTHLISSKGQCPFLLEQLRNRGAAADVFRSAAPKQIDWNQCMFDEVERVRANESLRRLLIHYAEAAETDREAWQDRLMELDGRSPDELVRLHGELLGHEWIEQNVGVLPVLRAGAMPQCYRVTAAGRRALKRSRESDADDHEALRSAA
jgi:hypothetical protein